MAALAVVLPSSLAPATAVEFSSEPSGTLVNPSATGTTCPTLSSIRPLEVWYNLDDMNVRGFADPGDQDPWPYMVKTAQVICGAAQGSKIRVGMFFIRAIGTMISETNLGTRPESDPEVVYRALEWVHKNRGVTIQIVLESKPTPASAKAQIVKRLVTPGIATLVSCSYGCFNTASPATFPYAINHEKIIAINHTVWGKSDANSGSDDSVMLASSGNWARSQTRYYWQESTLVWGDAKLHQLFADRFDAMRICGQTNCSTKSGFAGQQAALVKQRGIWVDPVYNHGTSPDRGTFVSFAPAPTSMRDYYVQALDKVDCVVENKVRVAMFRMTDEASKKILSAMTRLKNQGCSIKVILTTPVGGYSVSSYIKDRMSAAGIPLRCSKVPIHTKLVLIGSATGNEAKMVVSTATMSVISLTQSDEHTTTFDSTRATGTYAEAIRRAYGEYATGWDSIWRETTGC